MKPIDSLVLIRSLPGVALLAFSVWSATALPNITSVVERGGDEEATDTITARFTGQTFVNGIANEPLSNTAATDPYTVGVLVDEAPAFVDRNHQLTAATPTILIPQYLLGGEYIMSGNDNRDNATYELDITISRDSYVYFLVDNRMGDASGANPPNFDANMTWLIEGGWVGVTNGINRTSDLTVPDEIGLDEGADGAGPGQGVNQWSSVYVKFIPAGTFTVFQPDNAGQNMYSIVIKEVPRTPTVTLSAGDLFGVTFEVTDGAVTALATNSIALRFDGVAVTPQAVSKTGTVTKIKYTAPSVLPSGSPHTAVLTFSDNATPAGSFSETFNFNADVYGTLGAAHSVPAGIVDTASSGFTARVAQAKDDARWPGPDLPNSTKRAEDQLAGRLTEPQTGQPLQNFAVAGTGPGGTHNATLINWNQELTTAGNNTEIGNFTTASNPSFPDAPLPGIPGTDPESALNTDNIAAEIVGYLELTAGVHRFGVNSDDGFRLTASADPFDPAPTQLGIFEGGRGSGDTLFYVQVLADGIYPVRLIWYEGGGGANLEFFSLDPASGNRILVNDRANAAGIKSYSSPIAATLRPYASVSPLHNATGVAGSAAIDVRLFDRGAAVAGDSIQLTLNGAAVTPSTNKIGAVTVVSYDPPGLLASGSTNAVRLIWRDNGATAVTTTNEWSFVVENHNSFPRIPASWAVPPANIDLNSSGLNVDTYQMAVARSGFVDNDSSAAAEMQLARGYIDAATGLPYENLAFAGPNADSTYTVDLMNWTQDAPTAGGGFTAANGNDDLEIPGISSGAQDNIVAEAITYLELKAGTYQFGVNSDDGFKLTTAPNPRDSLPVQLGIFNTGRGFADSLFSFVVEQDGIYPFRLLWWEGGGGAGVEFFVVNRDTGARVLINDRLKNFGVKAYSTYRGTARPLVKSVSPAPGASGVSPLSSIEVTVANVGSTTIGLTLNGAPLATTPTTTGTNTVVRFVPTTAYVGGSTNVVGLILGTTTNSWSFVVTALPVVAITSPTNNATFASVPASITILADATVSGSQLSRVEFFHGGTTKIGEATSAPYSVAWNNVAGGRYTLTARATDTNNQSTVSAPVNILVGAAIIGSVVETGGDEEATDTIVAQFTGQTFVNGVANEPLLNTPIDAPYTVGTFGENAPMYVDRAHRWVGASPTAPIPSYLLGADYIMSGNDNRDNVDYRLDITVSEPSLIYLLVDNRLSDADGATPPDFTTAMTWVVTDGWLPVTNGINRTASTSVPDEVGADEGSDGTINQWSSVYVKSVPAGMFSLFQADNAGQNMYGVVIRKAGGVVVEQVVIGQPTLSGNNLTLSWTGGVGPFVVQKKLSLTDANWVTVTTTAARTASVAIESGNAFFRIADNATP